MKQSSNKFLLVGFDGLRPEMMTQALMPNLHRHASQGVTFTNHRCAFPSETYVNLISLVTGRTLPGELVLMMAMRLAARPRISPSESASKSFPS